MISFQLPLDLHAVAAERAKAHGMTVDDYVQSRYVLALERHRDRVATRSAADPKAGVEPRPKLPPKAPRA